MTIRIVLAGVGGRGVLLSAAVIGEAARALGLPVLSTETHGMSQRGGAVSSHLKIGPGMSPMVRSGTADILIGFEKIEAIRNLSYVRDGGIAIINSPDRELGNRWLSRGVAAKALQVHLLDADREALGLGAARSANMVILGYLSGIAPGELKRLDLLAAVQKVSPSHSLAVNLKAFHRGVELAQGQVGEAALAAGGA